MKKTTSKVSKASAKAAPKAAPAKASKAEKPAEAAPKAVKAKAPAKPKAAKEAKPVVKESKPAVKLVAVEALPVTTLIANVDVGFGNALYVRGEGAGLSWDQGMAMENLSPTQWKLSLEGASSPVAFKFLINDSNWCIGDDYVAVPGSTCSLVPLFEK